jgi:xylulokinase
MDSHVARGKYAAIGCAVAADMLEWFRTQFGAEETRKAATAGGVDWDLLMAQAEQTPPGAEGLLFLPHMSGSTFPVVDPASTGAFTGLRNIHTKGHLVRAMVEGLNYQFLQMVRGFGTALGINADRFVTVGGGAQNRFWVQTKADLLGKPFETPQLQEATPLGAAILAGIGVGLYRDEQEAFERVFRPGPIFEPNPHRTAQYAERFALYEKLYPALRAINAPRKIMVPFSDEG